MGGTLDRQQVEILGRGLLVARLMEAGVEVARPERDKGIDLIAYLDHGRRFVACPIQMKAATTRCFSISKHYQDIPDLLIAFVWRVLEPPDAEVYALTYPECLEVAKELGWTKSRSWKNKGRYVSTKPGAKVLAALKPHQMRNGDDWANRLRSASQSEPG